MLNPVQQYLEQVVAACPDGEGEVATYIPELARADPDGFALCLATVDGQVYEVGEAGLEYSIQSISKPFSYARALLDRGEAAVSAKVGVEPSGDAFNEISLAADSGRPSNPMINAGAITATSLVAEDESASRFERLLDFYSRCAGRPLALTESVYRSELATAHRNRAIAHLLREFEILSGDPEQVLDDYVRQCSVAVTTRDLALMAATLANAGQHPVSEQQVLPPRLVEHVLSVMTTCGMYDAAGDWVSSVGMPAKSGVSGAILGVLPGQVGVAVYSPRLDGHGNSARGVALFERLSADMEMHLMHVSRGSRSAVRNSYPLDAARSRVRRSEAENRALDELGGRCRIYELHGDLLFAGAERIVRAVVEDVPEIAVLDFSHVNEVAGVGRRTLLALRDRLAEVGSQGVVVDPFGVVHESDVEDEGEDADQPGRTRRFRDLPSALQWCEAELLARHGGPPEPCDPLAEHPLLLHLDEAELESLRPLLRRRQAAAGETVLAVGDPFAGVHLVVSGRAVAREESDGGAPVVLARLGPGSSFGELALGTGGVQEVAVVAETELELLVLPVAELDQLAVDDPAVGLRVWRAIACDGYRLADHALRRAG